MMPMTSANSHSPVKTNTGSYPIVQEAESDSKSDKEEEYYCQIVNSLGNYNNDYGPDQVSQGLHF